MRGLAELLAEPSGRALLIEHGISTDPQEFTARLSRPQDGYLANNVAGEWGLSVYVHQQPSPDYAPSVVAKFQSLADLNGQKRPALVPCFVTIDTDRAASSKSATRIGWRDADGRVTTFKLTPPGSKHMEFRHIQTNPAQLQDVARRIASRLHSAAAPGARERLERLTPLLAPTEGTTYSHYASDLAEFLLGEVMGNTERRMFVSTLQDHPTVLAALVRFLGSLDGFVSAFNQQIKAFHAMNVATAVSALPPDYLPLFYSCPIDGERTRLRRRMAQGEVIAEAHTHAGRNYRFSLGRGDSIEALFATRRCSIDVMLPVVLSDLFSGLVAGRSSALYCMVMRAAMKDALGETMIPILAPPSLACEPVDPRGLVQRWLMEGPR